MSAEQNAPIIVKKKKVIAGGGHHGGAWKVAYADFVTAMMAFFLLMWLLNATTESQRKGIADYFNPSIPLSRVSGGGDGSFGGDSVFTEDTLVQNGTGASKLKPTIQRAAKGSLGTSDGADNKDTAPDDALADIENELLGRSGESMSTELAMRHVVTRLTDEGLIVELFDIEGEFLFDQETGRPTETLVALTDMLGNIFSLVTNPIAIKGYVREKDGVERNTDGWEQSVDRVQTARQLLESAGISGQRIERLTGFGDGRPVTADAKAVRNSRLEFILLRSDV